MLGNEINAKDDAPKSAREYLELTVTHGLLALAGTAVIGGAWAFYPLTNVKGLLVYAALSSFVLATFTAYAVLFRNH